MGNLKDEGRKFGSRKQLANGDSISFSCCFFHNIVICILIGLKLQYTQFYRIKGRGGSGASPPPPPRPIIFERQILPQQTVYRWKGNLTANRIHIKYWKNTLISRFYEQFSRNDSAMAPERLFKKFKL